MVIVSYVVVLEVGRLSWLMNLCRVSCMICVVIVVGLGSVVCSWYAGDVSVVVRVDMASASLRCGRGLSPVCSFAWIAIALSILI